MHPSRTPSQSTSLLPEPLSRRVKIIKLVRGAWCRKRVAGTERAAENLSRNSLVRSVMQGGTELQEGIRGVGLRISNLGSGV